MSAFEDEVEDEECEKETCEVAEGQEDNEALGHAVERHSYSSYSSRRKKNLFPIFAFPLTKGVFIYIILQTFSVFHF